MLIGYDLTSKGYCCYLPSLKKIVVPQDVTFNEGNYYHELGPLNPSTDPEFRVPITKVETTPITKSHKRYAQTESSNPSDTILAPQHIQDTTDTPSIQEKTASEAIQHTEDLGHPSEILAQTSPIPQIYSRRETTPPRQSTQIRKPSILFQECIYEITSPSCTYDS